MKEAPRIPTGVYVAVLAFAAFVAFAPSLGAGFVYWDDGIEIYRNPHLGPPTLDRLAWMFTDTKYVWRYQPLTWLGWSINYLMGGLDPTGYHVGNILLHVASSIVLFFCLRRLFVLIAPEKTKTELAALAGALLWSLHPLRAEPVAWATGRLYCQPLFFAFMAFWFYLRARYPLGARSIFNRDYWWALVFLCLSLLSYPLAVGLAPALVVLDWYVSRKQNVPLRLTDFAKPAAPLWIATAVIFSISLLARFFVRSEFTAPEGFEKFGLAERAAQASYIWSYFLWRPFWPVDLSPLYTDLLRIELTAPRFLIGYGVVAAATVVAIVKRKSWPGFAAFWAAHLLLLFPHWGLTEHPHFPSDRYSYLPGVALMIFLGAGAIRIRLAHRAFVVAALALGVLTFKQTGHWKDSFALLNQVLAVIGEHPARAEIYARFAMAHAEAGEFEKGPEWIEKSLAINSQNAKAPADFAAAAFHAGKLDIALVWYKRAAAIDTKSAEHQTAIGDVLYAQKNFVDAANSYRAALALQPNSGLAHSNLAIALARAGARDEAEKHFRRAVELEPANSDYAANLKRFLERKGSGGG